MAKDKERSINPAAAQRKLDKQKQLKKGKAETLARRNEKLARRNPERIQRQIDDLKAMEESGQTLRPRDKQVLEELERDLRAVNKAREALGDKAPKFRGQLGQGHQGGRGDDNAGVLGKRRREGGGGRPQWKREESDSSDTDDSVRRIPMPRDTPPPIPPQHRRGRGTNANMEPLGEGRGGGERQPHVLPPKPAAQAEVKTVYEAAPEIRDLRKEAVNKFVPSVVRRKQEAVRGQGSLVEPEEMDRLEKEGYIVGGRREEESKGTGAVPRGGAEDAARLAEEEERFNRELRSVQIEEVEDEEL